MVQATTQQLVVMGFDEADVVIALSLNRNDFERALDSLCRQGTERD